MTCIINYSGNERNIHILALTFTHKIMTKLVVTAIYYTAHSSGIYPNVHYNKYFDKII